MGQMFKLWLKFRLKTTNLKFTFKQIKKKTLWPLFMDGVQLPQG